MTQAVILNFIESNDMEYGCIIKFKTWWVVPNHWTGLLDYCRICRTQNNEGVLSATLKITRGCSSATLKITRGCYLPHSK